MHVGVQQSRRLLGGDHSLGPYARLLLNWARHPPVQQHLQILHIRDMHKKVAIANNEDESLVIDHLNRFGEHCIQGTLGANLVLGIGKDVAKYPNEAFLDVKTGLNDLKETCLEEIIKELKRKSNGGGLIFSLLYRT